MSERTQDEERTAISASSPSRSTGFLGRIFRRRRAPDAMTTTTQDAQALATVGFEASDAVLDPERADAYYGTLLERISGDNAAANPSTGARIANDLLASVLDAQRWHLRNPPLPGVTQAVYVRHYGLPSPETIRPDLEALARREDAPAYVLDVARMLTDRIGPLPARPEISYETVGVDEWLATIMGRNDLVSHAQLTIGETPLRDRFVLRVRESWFTTGFDAASRESPLLYRDIEAQYHLVWNALLGGVKMECKRGRIHASPKASSLVPLNSTLSDAHLPNPAYDIPIPVEYYPPVIANGNASEPFLIEDFNAEGNTLRIQIIKNIHREIKMIRKAVFVTTDMNEKEERLNEEIARTRLGDTQKDPRLMQWDYEHSIITPTIMQAGKDSTRQNYGTRPLFKARKREDTELEQIAWVRFSNQAKGLTKRQEFVHYGINGRALVDAKEFIDLDARLREHLFDGLSPQYRGPWPPKE